MEKSGGRKFGVNLLDEVPIRHFDCPHCYCFFFTERDLALHLKAVSSGKHLAVLREGGLHV